MFALIDCNNFYVSCERFFSPGLNKKPVIVLSNNDGCAISRSDEAKELGIKMGAAPHLISDVIQQQGVKMFSSNYELYGDISDRVMKTLAGFVPRMEIYSIDEAFLDMPGRSLADDHKLAFRIRNTILQHFRIPTCIGIARTKTLAKMANHFAKKNYKASGIYHVKDEETTHRMLSETAVADIWGVGQQYSSLLKKNDINSALDFVNAPTDFIRSAMNVVGVRMQDELKGIPCLEWQTEPSPKKIIASSRSFGIIVKDKDTIKQALGEYAAIAALKLRKQQSVAGNLKVFVHTNPYRTQDQQYYQSVVVEMERATGNTIEIIKYAFQGLDLIFRNGFNYMKCGIELGKIVPEDQVQLSLFSLSKNVNSDNALKALDNINNSFGKEMVKLGIQGREKKYSGRVNHLSKRFTTRFDEILKIKI